MNDTVKLFLGALIRHGLSVVGSVLGAEGYFTGDDTNLIAGAIVALISACWSVFEKHRRQTAP